MFILASILLLVSVVEAIRYVLDMRKAHVTERRLNKLISKAPETPALQLAWAETQEALNFNKLNATVGLTVNTLYVIFIAGYIGLL